jgi:Ca-activated chloride channel homolog
LLASLCYEFPVKPRPREVKLVTGREPKAPADRGVATVATLVLALFFAPFENAAQTPTTPPPPPLPAPAPASPADALAKIVGRLSIAEARRAQDWAEFAGETVTWGRRLQSEQQPVAEGPVRDALAAVDLGSAADAKTADWPKLREELEALLKKPEEKKNEQQQQQQNQKQNQDQDKKNQDQKNEEQQKQESQDQKPSDQNQKSEPQKQNEEPKQNPESAFGDMKEKSEPPPPPPQSETQKVGGTPEKRPNDPAAADPTLVQPLQKLDQLRNEDSPAKLFQLMEGERKPTPNKKGKDW